MELRSWYHNKRQKYPLLNTGKNNKALLYITLRLGLGVHIDQLHDAAQHPGPLHRLVQERLPFIYYVLWSNYNFY